MRRLTLLLSDAPLETVPRQLWGHPSVAGYARRRGRPPYRTLLDASVHWQAMKRLPGRERRGRPDIVHVALLLALDSPLCRGGCCRLYLHTVEDKIIEVDPSTRLPRSYQRFVGLMEQLLVEGRVPPAAERPLMRVTGLSLGEVAGSSPVIVWRGGDEVGLREAARVALESGVLVVPLAPRGSAPAAANTLPGRHLYPRGLVDAEPWTLLYHLLVAVEEEAGLLG